MNSANDREAEVRARLHRAIDATLPTAGAEERVLQSLSDATARGSRRFALRLRGGFGAALMAAAVVLVIGGAIGLSLSLRSHTTSGGTPAAPAGQPRPASSPTATLPTPTPSPVPATTSPAPAIPACDSSMLSGHLADTVGAAGSRGADIVLHNVSHTVCTMKGYTNLYGESGSHVTQLGVTHNVPANLINNNNHTLPLERQVTIAPGQDAYVAIEWNDVITGPTMCPDYSSLLIVPPQGGHPVTIPGVALTPCGGFGAAMWVDETPVSSYGYFAVTP